MVLRVIYVMLGAKLLWYQKFKKHLKSILFVFNKYDPCVANITVNKKQHIFWFPVDHILSSHLNNKVNETLLKWLNKNYRKLKNILWSKERYMSICEWHWNLVWRVKSSSEWIILRRRWFRIYHINWGVISCWPYTVKSPQ